MTPAQASFEEEREEAEVRERQRAILDRLGHNNIAAHKLADREEIELRRMKRWAVVRPFALWIGG